jgi:hypothetical protein
MGQFRGGRTHDEEAVDQPCSETYEDSLYGALDACQCRHATRHGVYMSRLMASNMDVAVSGASGMRPGEQSRCGIWFASCRIAGGLSHVGHEEEKKRGGNQWFL